MQLTIEIPDQYFLGQNQNETTQRTGLIIAAQVGDGVAEVVGHFRTVNTPAVTPGHAYSQCTL